jgi:hypothetical protein
VKRAAAALVLLALAGCVSPGIFARVEVACGAKALVYSNADKFDEKITVELADRCAGADSELQLVNANGTVVQTFPVPDGTSKTIEVTVPNGDWLNFVCNGTQGGCWYAVTSSK